MSLHAKVQYKIWFRLKSQLQNFRSQKDKKLSFLPKAHKWPREKVVANVTKYY